MSRPSRTSNRRRGVAALVLLAVAAGSGSGHAAERWTYPLAERRHDAARARLEIHCPRGRVVLAPSPDGAIGLEGDRLVEAARRERAALLAQRLQVRVWQSADVWRLEVEMPDEAGRGPLAEAVLGPPERLEVELRVAVPAGSEVHLQGEDLAVEAHELAGPIRVRNVVGDINLRDLRSDADLVSGSGRVRVHGAGGAVHIEAGSGDVSLQRIAGGVTLRSTSGSVVVDDVGGATRAETTSGRLQLARCRGPVRASTASGPCSFEGLRDRVDVQSASGDVVFELDPSTGAPVRIETASGDVEVRVAAGGALHLAVFTDRGALRVELPGLVVQERTRQILKGRLGTGPAAELHVRSARGAVRVESADARPAARP
jgi:DUF4097 and DUF4098 domain-containing protein YvlB